MSKSNFYIVHNCCKNEVIRCTFERNVYIILQLQYENQNNKLLENQNMLEAWTRVYLKLNASLFLIYQGFDCKYLSKKYPRAVNKCRRDT